MSSYFDYEPEPESTVTLFSECLLSKWGFHDGDLLSWIGEFGDFDKHAVLCALVRQKLLPALTQKVEVIEISTCHNPIRAETVDGKDVRGLWFEAYEEKGSILTPSSVDVSGEEVLEIARSLPARSAH